MNWKKVGKLDCLGCGAALPKGVNRCSRCAMVAELISELIQKQVCSGPQLCREMNNAQAT